MRLEYENLTVRSAEDADVPLYVIWWNDGELQTTVFCELLPENFVSYIK